MVVAVAMVSGPRTFWLMANARRRSGSALAYLAIFMYSEPKFMRLRAVN